MWTPRDDVGPLGLGGDADNRDEGATQGCVVTEMCAGMAGADLVQD